jgi:hypothetical protein
MKRELVIGVFIVSIIVLAGMIIAQNNDTNQSNETNQTNNQTNNTLTCQEDHDCANNYECEDHACVLDHENNNKTNKTEDDNENETDHEDNETEIKVCCLRTITKGNESYQKYNFIEKEECLEFGNKTNKQSEIVNDSSCKERKMNKTEDKEDVKERQRLKFENKTGIACPNDCICTGVVMKCVLEDGTRIMNVYASSGNLIIQIKDDNVTTNVTLYKDENGTLYTNINGKEKKIKIYPDQIREKIKEKIKANLEDENFKINDKGNYDFEAKKNSRLFWIIPAKEKVNAEVDSENGTITKIHSSWWGFLARDKKD